MKAWELGSEFHWQGIPEGPYIDLPSPSTYFGTGRVALLSICRLLGVNSGILHIPEYFCPEVVNWFQDQGIVVRRYVDGPFQESPELEYSYLNAGDILLAVNYFGVSDGTFWRSWEYPGVTLVEDHTHDPFSSWAKNSTADYAFASLRKTLPIPDGALVWSPKGRKLPELFDGDVKGSSLKLAAMILKKEYLEDPFPSLKQTFREMQVAGEARLSRSNNCPMSPWSKFLVLAGYPTAWRERKLANLLLFYDLIRGNESFKPYFTSWPEGHCPFNALLEFSDRKKRDEMRSRLCSSNIYTSVHWDMTSGNSKCNDFCGRVLTIPVDYRYGEADIYRLAEAFQ